MEFGSHLYSCISGMDKTCDITGVDDGSDALTGTTKTMMLDGTSFRSHKVRLLCGDGLSNSLRFVTFINGHYRAFDY